VLVFETTPYKTRHLYTGTIIEKTVIGTVEKYDESGVILDPALLEFKCGWGVTLEAAVSNFIERNPSVLRRQD